MYLPFLSYFSLDNSLEYQTAMVHKCCIGLTFLQSFLFPFMGEQHKKIKAVLGFFFFPFEYSLFKEVELHYSYFAFWLNLSTKTKGRYGLSRPKVNVFLKTFLRKFWIRVK